MRKEATIPATTHAASTQTPSKQNPMTIQKKQHEEQDVVGIIGRIAPVLSVIMYVSYITQIANNLGDALAAFGRVLQLLDVDGLRRHGKAKGRAHYRSEHPRHHLGLHHLHHRHRALSHRSRRFFCLTKRQDSLFEALSKQSFMLLAHDFRQKHDAVGFLGHRVDKRLNSRHIYRICEPHDGRG